MPKSHSISFRVSDDEYQNLSEKALKAGAKTVSSYLRALGRSDHDIQLLPKELKTEFRSKAPKLPDTRPTFIYLLVDIRPEVLKVNPEGITFYCGKTVYLPGKRLSAHRASAYTIHLHTKNRMYIRFRECDGYVKIVVVETVPIGADWAERECHWIDLSRQMYPESMTNVCTGGAGAPGYIRSAEHCAKLSSIWKGRPKSPEHRARIGAALKLRHARLTGRVSDQSGLDL